jgi:hypothetical protein
MSEPTQHPEASEPRGTRNIASPITLRITSGEVLESQLPEDDLAALGIHTFSADSSSDSSGGPPTDGGTTKCEKNYIECPLNYEKTTTKEARVLEP